MTLCNETIGHLKGELTKKVGQQGLRVIVGMDGDWNAGGRDGSNNSADAFMGWCSGPGNHDQLVPWNKKKMCLMGIKKPPTD